MAEIFTYTYNLNLDLSTHPINSITIKQYGKNTYYLNISVTQKGVVYIIDPASYRAYFKMKTPDKRYIYQLCEIDESGRVICELPESAAWASGVGEAEIEVIKNDGTVRMSTCSFEVVIDPSAYPEEEITGSNDFSALVDYVSQAGNMDQQVQEAQEAAETASSAQTAVTEMKTTIEGWKTAMQADKTDTEEAKNTAVEAQASALQSAQSASADAEELSSMLSTAMAMYNGPLTASDVSQMTDHTKVYVFTGTDVAGMNKGDWYYWDNSVTAWVSGGQYLAGEITVDDTLTQTGQAADAKKTGDEITSIKSDLDYSKITTDTLSGSDLEYGALDNDGMNAGSMTYRMRTTNYIALPEKDDVSVDVVSDKDIYFTVWYYTANDYSTPRIAAETWRKSGKLDYPSGAKYIRLVFSISKSTTQMSSSDISSITVSYSEIGVVKLTPQTLTEEQKAQVKENLGIEEQSIPKKTLYIGPLQLGHISGNLINLTDSYANKRICMSDLVVFPTKYKKIKINFNEKYHINAAFGTTAYDFDSSASGCPNLYTLNNNNYVTESGSEFEIPEFINYYRFIVVLGSDHNHEFSEVPDDIDLEVEYEDSSNVLLTNASPTNCIISAKGVKEPRPNSSLSRYVPSLFVIGHASDTHGDIKRTKNFFDYCEYIDADMACVTGDIVTTNTQSGANWFLELVNNLKRTVPAICIGNHEVWPSNRPAFSDADVYNEYVAPIASKLQNTTGKTWYSVTFADKLIKVISLNQYQESGLTTQDRGLVHFKDDQISWFINELKNTPANYGVILLYHQPDGHGMPPETSGYTKFYCIGDGYTPESQIYGGLQDTPIVDIIDAFIGRTTLNKTYQQTGTPSSFTVNADFSTVANGVEFIAHLFGHCHSDKITYYQNAQHKQLMCLVAITNTVYGKDYTGGYAESSDVIKEMGTHTEDAFNVYVVDRANKLFKVVRVGNTKTYEMQDRDYMAIPYAD